MCLHVLKYSHAQTPPIHYVRYGEINFAFPHQRKNRKDFVKRVFVLNTFSIKIGIKIELKLVRIQNVRCMH